MKTVNERYHTPGQALDPEPLIRLPFRGKPQGINPCFPCAHSGMNKFTPLIPLGNKFFLSHEVAIYWGTINDNVTHNHYAMQLTIGLNNTFNISVNSKNTEVQTAVLKSKQNHQIQGRDTTLLVILAEPLSPHGLFIQSLTKKPLHYSEKLCSEINDILRKYSGNIPVRNFIDTLLLKLGKPFPPSEINDKRIKNSIDYIKENSGRVIFIHELADSIALSESRLQHLFKEKTGVPISQYVIWERMKNAIKAASTNQNLTAAAFDAGFSDSAHISRTFKSMFGLNPSRIFKDSRIVQVYCD